MTYQSRFPVDAEYLRVLGAAFYNFTHLEWVVVWTIVKLSANGFASVPRGKTASIIAKALIKAIDKTSPPLRPDLRKALVAFHESYVAAIRTRNKLLHAHPYTARDGVQQLGGGGLEWPISVIIEAAQFYEEAAIKGNAIFHGDLAKVRP